MRTVAPAMLALLLAIGGVAACGASSAPAPEPTPSTPATAEAPAPPATPAGPGTITAARFQSAALGVEKRYMVYLPASYAASPERRYPVLYMLHGLGGSEENWRDIGIAKAADEIGLEAIIVMPDGDDSFYVNWVSAVDYDACLQSRRAFGKADDMATYCVKSPRYDDYIAVDLVAHVDQTYRTIGSREARAIGGLSMGGYGALYHAARHNDLFGAVASHAGAVSLLYKGPHPYRKGAVELVDDPGPGLADAGPFGSLFRRIWGDEIETWRAHDPIALAAALDDGRLAIYLDCGTADEFKLHDANQYLNEVLTENGIEHTFHLIEGGHHNGDFWSSRVDDSLAFFKAYFAD